MQDGLHGCSKNPDAPAEDWLINRKGQKPWHPERNRRRFTYEPRVIGGKLLMPARYVIETPVLKTVTEEIRAVVENVWPELISSFPRGLEMPSRGGG